MDQAGPSHAWNVNGPQKSRPFQASSTADTTPEICNVWRDNLEDEFVKLRVLIQNYQFVAMDTEFPGMIFKMPRGVYPSEAMYQTLKKNCDKLKLIQLGLTFFNQEGKTPKDEYGYSTWQFHFQYNLSVEAKAADSIQLLVNSGINFDKHQHEGIIHVEFAELLISSGIILVDEVHFIAFHACYDLGYMMRMLTGDYLPSDEADFMSFVKLYFPNMYDVDYLAKKTNQLFGGLQAVANQLGMIRVGTSHQAGSDALLTGNVFFKMQQLFFNNNAVKAYSGYISGLKMSYCDVL